jgi:hypothetical protein
MNSSIVEKDIFQLFTGLKIGIDIHSQYDRKLHLCWKSKMNTKCIERYDDGSEFDQIMKELNDPGIEGVCSCAINI